MNAGASQAQLLSLPSPGVGGVGHGSARSGDQVSLRMEQKVGLGSGAKEQDVWLS